MGEIKSDDKTSNIDFEDPKFYVTKSEFMKILNEEFVNKKKL